ncbi:MAG: hypothetical protein ACTSPM_03980 [Candidatus Heimdallarchaeota archaeon]
MGISFKYAQRIAKLGTQLLIPLIVFDTTWALIRFILYNTTFVEKSTTKFNLIESIITNALFASFACVLAIGIMMLGIYYIKINKLAIIASIALLMYVGIKVAFIFFKFSQLIPVPLDDYMNNTFYIFELITSLLLILVFIIFDIFQRRLKIRGDIGYGGSIFPYIFGTLALVYPISNFLSLLQVDYESNAIAFPIMRTIAFVACMIEILIYFDLLRRFDFMRSIDNKSKDEAPLEIDSESVKSEK